MHLDIGAIYSASPFLRNWRRKARSKVIQFRTLDRHEQLLLSGYLSSTLHQRQYMCHRDHTQKRPRSVWGTGDAKFGIKCNILELLVCMINCQSLDIQYLNFISDKICTKEALNNNVLEAFRTGRIQMKLVYAHRISSTFRVSPSFLQRKSQRLDRWTNQWSVFRNGT